MDPFPAFCQRRSMPVEMDESMTSSSLNLALSVSQQCLEPGRPRQSPVIDDDWTPPPVTINSVPKMDYPGELWDEPVCRAAKPPNASVGLELSPCLTPPHQSLEINDPRVISWMEKVPGKDSPVHGYYRPPKEPPSMDPSLEPPGSLHSASNAVCQRPIRCHLPCCNYPVPPHCLPGNRFAQPCPGLHPADPARQHHYPNTPPVQDQRHHPKLGPAVKGPGQQNTFPVREIMTEVCPKPSLHPAPTPIHAPEMKKTISLPDNCRNLFITYSIDTTEDIPAFVSFLMTQGFRPSIDIFDDPVRRLDINKWMDSFLKDKSVLIIMVISPKYKLDIEGDGSDEHGLHTKYIHSQLQNEFIQQRCMNFRLVPVLFPNATRAHIPIWLQSTRIYRWPQDMQDLLLRLLREERYIAPPMGKELTLTIRPI